MVAIIHISSFYLPTSRDIKTELIHIYENAKKYSIELETTISSIQYDKFPIIIKGTHQGYQFEFLIIQTRYYTFSLRSINPSKVKRDINGKEGIDLAFYTVLATQLIEGYAIQKLRTDYSDLKSYAPPTLNY